MMLRAFSVPFVAFMLASCLVSAVIADDWLMFRKDAGRTAASSDKITLPLKPLWSWKSQLVGGFAPMSTAAVRKGLLYFIAGPKIDSDPKSKPVKDPKRMLVCADAATGKVSWTQPLKAPRMHPFIPEDVGPAVSESGTVYVLDTGTAFCADGFVIRAFSADKGKVLGVKAVPIRNTLSRFFLREGHGEKNYLLTSNAKPDC